VNGFGKYTQKKYPQGNHNPRGLIELEKRKESLLNFGEVDISEKAEASGSVFGFM